MQSLDIQKRSATTTSAPQVRHAADPVAKLIDISKCIGCKACEVACKQWNDMPAEVTRKAEGLSFVAEPAASDTTRSLQARLLDRADIIDAESAGVAPAAAVAPLTVKVLLDRGVMRVNDVTIAAGATPNGAQAKKSDTARAASAGSQRRLAAS